MGALGLKGGNEDEQSGRGRHLVCSPGGLVMGTSMRRKGCVWGAVCLPVEEHLDTYCCKMALERNELPLLEPVLLSSSCLSVWFFPEPSFYILHSAVTGYEGLCLLSMKLFRCS